MKIVIIHGQSHQGSTCHIARQLAEKLGGTVTEFFLPPAIFLPFASAALNASRNPKHDVRTMRIYIR